MHPEPNAPPSPETLIPMCRNRHRANGSKKYNVLSGPSAPSPSLGVDGDFYFGTSTNTVYGPKTNGTWEDAIMGIWHAATGGVSSGVVSAQSLAATLAKKTKEQIFQDQIGALEKVTF